MYKIYDIVLNSDTEGVQLISIVDEPAIQEMFVAMSNEKEEDKVSLSLIDEKQIVLGPALVPDKLIYRLDSNKQPYYIRFSKDVIEQTINKFFSTPNKLKMVDLNHNEHLVSDVYLVSSYMLSKNLSDSRFPSLPEGSWIVGYKVNNPTVWNEIKLGKFNGFSIEGMYNLVDTTQLSTESITISELINQSINKIK